MGADAAKRNNILSRKASVERKESMTLDEKELSAEKEASSEMNALQHNFATKGMTGYYYAHGDAKRGPAWDGDPSPRLLERISSKEASIERVAITRYSWLDDKSKIRIYLPFDESIPLKEDNITLEWSPTSIKMVWNLQNIIYTLRIPQLYDKIEDAVFRLKTDKVVITLKKPSSLDHTWYDLKKSAAS